MLALFVHKRHDTLLNAVFDEEICLDFGYNINKGVSNTVHVIPFVHRADFFARIDKNLEGKLTSASDC